MDSRSWFRRARGATDELKQEQVIGVPLVDVEPLEDLPDSVSDHVTFLAGLGTDHDSPGTGS
jgi:hypothetical protein